VTQTPISLFLPVRRRLRPSISPSLRRGSGGEVATEYERLRPDVMQYAAYTHHMLHHGHESKKRELIGAAGDLASRNCNSCTVGAGAIPFFVSGVGGYVSSAVRVEAGSSWKRADAELGGIQAFEMLVGGHAAQWQCGSTVRVKTMQDDDEELPLLPPKYNEDGSIRGHGRRKKRRVAFGTRLTPDIILMAKAQTRHSGEYLNQFLSRLIREEFERNPVSMD
jgi:hypothetical protein